MLCVNAVVTITILTMNDIANDFSSVLLAEADVQTHHGKEAGDGAPRRQFAVAAGSKQNQNEMNHNDRIQNGIRS